MADPTVRWNGENLAEVQHLLRSHEATAVAHGDVLVITGEGLGIMLNVGDELIRSGDQLGVVRPPTKTPDPEIMWTGHNIPEMSRFLSDFEVWCELRGMTLHIHDKRRIEKPARLDPGDKLIVRNGRPVVSKAGRDHIIH